MAKFWMINSVSVAGTLFQAGSDVDDALDPYASIVAAGGFLYPQGDPTVDAAAAVALNAHKNRGANETELAQIMSTAVDQVQKAAAATTDAALAADAATLQAGTVALTSGVSPAIAATITASSKIVGFLKTPSGGSLTVKFAALGTDRVVGAPGSFKLSALDAAGAVNAADGSALDWLVVNK